MWYIGGVRREDGRYEYNWAAPKVLVLTFWRDPQLLRAKNTFLPKH